MKTPGEHRSWCVVGGGMLGLTLANRLLDRGQRVTLLEASPRLGGLADAWQVGDVTWDRHYHVTLGSDVHLRALLEELGLDDQLVWSQTQSDFYTDGRFHPLNNSIDYLKFPPLGLIDKARLAFTIVYAAAKKDGRALETITLEDWLVRLSGRRTFEKIWLPLVRAKLGDNYRKASASYIWAVIGRFYGARSDGAAKTEQFGYVDGGYARINERFEQVLRKKGIDIKAGTPVREIQRDGGAVWVETGDGERLSFDSVAVTAASGLATKMCSGLSPTERHAHNRIVYQGIVCPSVVLKRPLRGCYITYIADEDIPFTAVIEMTALVDRAKFGGRTLAYLPAYVPCDDALFDVPDDEIEARFLGALKSMYRDLDDDDIEAFRISRVRRVLAITTLNYSENLPPMKTSVPGLYIVNSAHIVNATLNVNDTVKLANEAAEMLIETSARDARTFRQAAVA